LKTRTKRGQMGQKLKGRSAGENVYGYKSVGDGAVIQRKGVTRHEGYKHVIHEEEAKVVCRIFEMYDRGKSPVMITKELNDAGLRAKKGGAWRDSTVVRILKNERYVGVWVYNKTQVVYNNLKGTKRQVPRPREDWHIDNREDLRIIPQDLWEAVQEKLKAASKPFPGRNGKGKKGVNTSYVFAYPKDPFDGLMECGVCGNSIMKVAGTRGGYYGCHMGTTGACLNKVIINKPVADEKIIELLLGAVLKPESIEKVYQKVERLIRSYKGDVPEKLQEIQRELRKVNTEINNYAESIRQGSMSKTIIQRLDDAEVTKGRLDREVDALEKAKANMFTAPSKELIERQVKKLKSMLKDKPEEAAQILRRLFGRIVFHPVYPEGEKPYYRLTSKVQTLALLKEDEGSSIRSNTVHWWRRRESNPRPKTLRHKLLHA